MTDQLRSELQERVEAAYMGGASIEDIKDALSETEQRVEDIAGVRGEA